MDEDIADFLKQSEKSEDGLDPRETVDNVYDASSRREDYSATEALDESGFNQSSELADFVLKRVLNN